MSKLGRAIADRFNGRDLVIVAGLVLTGAGLWQFSPSIAVIVVGSVLLYIGLFWRSR